MESNNLQPLYIQVVETLKQRIDEGFYPKGSKLPSESQLVSSLGVSRVTIRKALSKLAEIGYTKSQKGMGTFVSHQKLRHDFLGMESFSQEASSAGFTVKNSVKQFEIINADEDLANKLKIDVGDEVNYTSRIRFIDDEPICYEEFYIARKLLPKLDIDDMTKSKFEYLSDHGINMVKTHQKLIPALPDNKIQSLLNVHKTEPILVNQSLNYLSEEMIYEYSIVYYKSSSYEFEILARV